MLPLDYKEIETILAIYHEKSINRAGISLGVTGPAISQRLSRIEDKLGYRIADRYPVVSFNEYGTAVLDYCRDIQNGFNNFTNRIASLQKPSIKIMADLSLLMHDLPPVLHAMRAEFPELQATLLTGTFSEIVQAVADKTIDAGIIAGEAGRKGVETIRFRKERICLLTPGSHPLARHRAIGFVMAIKYPLIMSGTLEHITPIIIRTAATEGIKPNFSLITPNFEAQATFALTTDLGAAPIIESAARRYVDIHGGNAIKIIDDWADNTLSLCVGEHGSWSDELTSLVKNIISLNRPDW